MRIFSNELTTISVSDSVIKLDIPAGVIKLTTVFFSSGESVLGANETSSFNIRLKVIKFYRISFHRIFNACFVFPFMVNCIVYTKEGGIYDKQEKSD